MDRRARITAAGLGLLCLATVPLGAAPPAADPETRPSGVRRASGTFEVKVTPLPKEEKVPGLAVDRLSFVKQFHGDLVGTSAGEMMTPPSAVQGSGGYVAVEQFTGTVHGRAGTFAVIHQGTMRKGVPGFDLVIKVVPDSATGDLTGLAGTMRIVIEGGKHSYELEYTLPGAPPATR